jgi:histidyl-tRNA synthetase
MSGIAASGPGTGYEQGSIFGQHHPNHQLVTVPTGTSDVIGHDMRIQQHILETIQRVYERFGFMPQDTPIIENDVVFKGHHGEGESLIFRLNDKGDLPLVLRYDQTVPLARVFATHPELPRPYSRYQIGPVFRDDVDDGRHFRQFIQCDGDIVGCSSLLADADILMLAYAGLEELGFPNFTIRINHRKIFQGIASLHGITEKEKVVAIQRALDRADKCTCDGAEGIKRELSEFDIGEEVADTLFNISALSGKPLPWVLGQLEAMLGNQRLAMEGIRDLKEIMSYLPEQMANKIAIDMSLARGADYYTGFILEGVVDGIPIGAVLGGGRYDNLLAAFGRPSEPAVGMAFGYERIILAMKQLGMLDSMAMDRHKVLVSCSDRQHLPGLAKLAQALRSQSLEVVTAYEVLDDGGLSRMAAEQHCPVIVHLNGGTEVRTLPGFENSELYNKAITALNGGNIVAA